MLIFFLRALQASQMSLQGSLPLSSKKYATMGTNKQEPLGGGMWN